MIPVFPVAPVGPVGPLVPVHPVIPVLPVGPVTPVNPIGPVLPVIPSLDPEITPDDIEVPSQKSIAAILKTELQLISRCPSDKIVDPGRPSLSVIV